MWGVEREQNGQNVMAEVLWPGNGSSIIIVSFTGSDLGTWLCLTAKKLEKYIIPQ